VSSARAPLDLHLTRRQLLQLGAIGVATLAPGWRALGEAASGTTAAAPLSPFLTTDELAVLRAMLSRIIPTDASPGADEVGVASYVQGLLSALPAADANCDERRSAADLTAILLRLGGAVNDGCAQADVNGDGLIDSADAASAQLSLFEATPLFAGGPFSGRQPFGDFTTGEATDSYPANSFMNFLPLNRLQRLAWNVRLDGASTVAQVADNPLATDLPDVDLRRKYREGLAQIDARSLSMFGMPFVELNAAEQDQVLTAADSAFHNLVTGHAIEGFLCAPEYGGNRDRLGWQLVGFDGDSQPLGYTLGFDATLQQYIERVDKPNSKPNPDEDCRGLSPTVVAFVRTIASADETKPNKVFRGTDYCFEVPS
jgi:hypothetical protein